MSATTRKPKKPSMIEFTRTYANDEVACRKFFFSSNKGMSGIEMSSALDVNYKTALLLCRKCRVLMAFSDSGRTGIQNQSQVCRKRLDSEDT
ncbi:MAG: hypothetical protein PUA69_01140 [Erysipelotrichaceae bacterium]|nr:hypothetical protein [Erysipelotrichaceae bacterium]